MKAEQLERRYREKQRAAGIRQYIVNIDDWEPELLAEVDRRCELRQISRSEYLVELLHKDNVRQKAEAWDTRQEFICRRLMLPAHVWKFIENEAEQQYQGDIARVVYEMYHEARNYRAMMETPAISKGTKKRRKP